MQELPSTPATIVATPVIVTISPASTFVVTAASPSPTVIERPNLSEDLSNVPLQVPSSLSVSSNTEASKEEWATTIGAPSNGSAARKEPLTDSSVSKILSTLTVKLTT